MAAPEMVTIFAIDTAFDRISKLNADTAKKVLHEIPSSDRDVYHAAMKKFKKESAGEGVEEVSKIDKRLVTQLEALLDQVGDGTGTITSPRDATLNAVHALFLQFWRGLKNCLGLRISADEFLTDIQAHGAVAKRFHILQGVRGKVWEERFNQDVVVDDTIKSAWRTMLDTEGDKARNAAVFQQVFGKLQEKEERYLEAFEGTDGTAKKLAKALFKDAFIYHYSHKIIMGKDTPLAPNSLSDFYNTYQDIANPVDPAPDQIKHQNNAMMNLFALYKKLATLPQGQA